MGEKCLKCDGYDPHEYASECEDMYNANPLRCEKSDDAFETIRLDTSKYDDEFAMLDDFWDQLETWKEYSNKLLIKMLETIKKRMGELAGRN